MARLYDIKVEGDVAGVIKMPDRLKLATARSVDRTGFFARDEVIRELDEEFVLRGTWFKPKTRFGINFIPTQQGNLRAILFTNADWLLESEGYNGGIKRAEPGHKRLADPEDPETRGAITNKFPVAQKAGKLLSQSRFKLDKQGIRKVSLKTGRLLGGTGAFIVQPKNKPDVQYVFQRVGLGKTGDIKRSKKGVPLRGRIGKAGSKLILKHVLKKSVKVEQPKVIQNTVINTFRVWYPTYFGRDLILALKTAKL